MGPISRAPDIQMFPHLLVAVLPGALVGYEREHTGKPASARHGEVVKVSDEVTYRTWRLSISTSAYGFESGNFNIHQTLLAKITSEGTNSVPFSRTDLYVT